MPVEFERLRDNLRWAIPHGGMVEIKGEGLEEKVEIGAGVATLLVEIPQEGIAVNNLRGLSPKFKHFKEVSRWILDELLPRGLVEETEKGSGVYVVSEAARNAKYTFKPYLRDIIKPYLRDIIK